MSSRLFEGEREGRGVFARQLSALARVRERLGRPITPRIAWTLIALFCVGVVLLAARHYTSARTELTEAALARRAAVAQLAAATLSERHDRMVDVSVSLPTAVRFAELVAAGEWQAAARIMKSVPAEFRFVERILLTDTRGTVMAEVPELGTRGLNFAHRDWYQGVSAHWKPYISGVYRRAAHPQKVLFGVAAPIVDHAGAPSGILLMQVGLESFFDWAQEIDFGQQAIAYVIDAQGKLAFDSAQPGAAQSEIVDLSANPAVARLLAGKSGVEVLRTASGEERVYAYMPGRRGWDVVVAQPAAVAFAARDAQLRFVRLAYASIAAFVCAAAWLGVLELRRARRSLASHAERLRLLHEIDRAVIAEVSPEAIAAAVVQPLRELLGVPRAIVNRFDLTAGEVEWIAAAGRRRTHVGPGVRYPISLMGDLEALRRGEPQHIDVETLPASPEAAALLASDVR